MSEKGQSLIEVMVALGVSVIIITAIVMAVVLAVINTRVAKTQNLAAYYARQGMEVLRQVSRSDWTTFKGHTRGPYCLAKGETVLEEKDADCVTDPTNNFRREVWIQQGDENHTDCEIAASPGTYGIKVSVIVSWNDNKCQNQTIFCHQVKLDSCLQNINVVPTP
jgi:Tfp pilus assembly protein PilV